MSIWLIALISWIIVGLAFFIYAILTAETYPEELEKEEDKELKAKFEEYKKSRD